MSTVYSAVAEEFQSQLSSLHELLAASQSTSLMPSTRVASVRASTLLLASIFEEFVREMALERAMYVVNKATSLDEVPVRLVETAWNQTLNDIVHTKASSDSKMTALALTAKMGRPRFDAICLFVEGDITQNIFENLTQNRGNMRPDEINRLFRIGGVPNICVEVCKRTALQGFFGERGHIKTHEALRQTLNGFIDKRNGIAHAPNLTSSDSPDEVLKDIRMLSAFSADLEIALGAL